MRWHGPSRTSRSHLCKGAASPLVFPRGPARHAKPRRPAIPHLASYRNITSDFIECLILRRRIINLENNDVALPAIRQVTHGNSRACI